MFKSLKLNSLTDKIQYGIYYRGRKTQNPAKKLKLKMSQPEKYEKTSIMKLRDLRAPNITFPIKIPIRYKYVYKPPKNVPKVEHHDVLSFDNMTGNEILLHLEQSTQLRSVEITNALVELGKKPQADKFDWNEHEYVQNAMEILRQNLAQYKSYSISQLCLALHRLKINDKDQIWKELIIQCNKQMHNFTPHGFAMMVRAFFTNENRCKTEFQFQVISLLPTKLHKMSPEDFTECFKLCVQQDLITINDHIFENHFLVLFWRRNIWFGGNNYHHIIKGLYELKYFDHDNFWKRFLEQIPKLIKEMNEYDTQQTIQALQEIQDKIENVDCKEYIEMLEKHLSFCKIQMKAAENSKLFNVILNDIQYYREKQILKAQKAQ